METAQAKSRFLQFFGENAASKLAILAARNRKSLEEWRFKQGLFEECPCIEDKIAHAKNDRLLLKRSQNTSEWERKVSGRPTANVFSQTRPADRSQAKPSADSAHRRAGSFLPTPIFPSRSCRRCRGDRLHQPLRVHGQNA